MHCKAGNRKKYFTLLTFHFTLLIALLAAGCGLSDAREGIVIAPASSEPAADLGLGPGVRTLSFGPGDKGYPRVSPSGDRVAFVLDGYVVEKPLHAQGEDLYRTAKDFGATGAEWLLDGGLAVLSPEVPGPTPGSLFASRPDGVESADKLTGEVEAVGAIPGGQAVVAAITDTPESETPSSSLMLLWGPEEQERTYLGGRIEGYVTGLSVSPDRHQVVLAVRSDTGQSEVQVYRPLEGQAERVARLPEGIGILGAPQWTQGGIYFVAGEAARSGDPALYRVSEASEEPEPVREAGEGFVATSISVSPDGDRLAVVGRRNPGSPTNLYLLDLASDALEAATTNKNMEIKTTPRDLAWSPDGSAVILVARGALSGPEVYDAPAQSLSSAFYNLYEAPVGESGGSS